MEDVDEDWIFTWIHRCMCSCTHVCQHACKNPGIHIYMQNKWTVLFINVSLVLLEFLLKNYLFCFTCMVFYLHPYLCTMCVQYLWRPEEGTESCRTGVRSNCDPPCIGKRTWVFRKNSQCSSLMGHFCSSRLAFSCWCVGLCSLCLSGLAVLLFFSLVPWNAKHEGHLARQSLNHFQNCVTNKFSSYITNLRYSSLSDQGGLCHTYWIFPLTLHNAVAWVPLWLGVVK